MVRPLLLVLALTGCVQEPKPVDDGIETGTTHEDPDSDGFTVAEGDCDDTDADVFPGADELCNGLDDDCDSEVDEGTYTAWYADADGDGFGDPAAPAQGCENPGLPVDGDDCDDADITVHPGAAEVCDGVDQDCDGEIDEGVGNTWYPDADGDGYGDPAAAISACDAPEGYLADGTDCDDTQAAAFPGNLEGCDEVDNNCDGAVDEGVTTTWYVDTDGDGFGDPSLLQESCDLPTGYSRVFTDCDDTVAEVNPDADELCNGIDDDCDGAVDGPDSVDASTWYTDADGDTYGDPDIATLACDAPAGTVADATDCDDADATRSPDTVWYIDYDADTFGSVDYTLSQCEIPAGYVAVATDCDDASAAINPDATEVCNDLDDDCDGRTDDDDVPVSGTSVWYVDADGDTYGDALIYTDACDAPSGYGADATDCDDTDPVVYPGAVEAWYDGVDSDCDGADDPSVCDEIPGATTVAWDATCAYPYASTGWAVATEWTTDSTTWYATANTYADIMMTPVVGNLTDDNGDGLVDDQDIPDIAYTTFTGSSYSSAGYLRVVSGDGTEEHLSLNSVTSGATTYNIAGSAGVALGDLEGDGSPDIVTISTGGDIVALEADGTLKWVYPESYSVYNHPAIADMDGDGSAEILIGPDVLSASGTLVGSCPYGTDGMISFASDIDNDGTSELIVGSAVCEMNGAVVWDSGRTTGFPGVGNFDSDDYGEIVNVDRINHRVDLLDDDGTLLWSTSLTGTGGGAPVVGDFDGDGEPEIGVASSSRFTVLETTGAIKWAVTIDDSSSSSTSASAFDFDGDGDQEIVYADENELYVYDGATGAELYTTSSHQSGTIREYPVVADVDRDGQAEIVVASADYAAAGWAGIHVLGESNGEWASARFTSNQHAYSVLDIDDDLTVPAAPEGSWIEGWGLRAQRSWSDQPDGAADLAAVLLGVCEDCTPGDLDLYVSVENLGAVFVPDGVPVRVYAVDGAVETLLEEQLTTDPCEPGERQAPLRFTLAVADVGTDGLRVEVDSDDAVRECDESNNAGTWDALTCVP
ncbi:MAG: MopE-related protein [Pseudomonadota bacterium]|nr:MopE-related protein [Pseudomonadota bacterium]